MLHIFGLFKRFPVDIDDVVFDSQTLAGKADGAFHEVLATVHRTHDYLAELRLIVFYVLAGIRYARFFLKLIHQVVPVQIGGHSKGHCVGAGSVEDYYVAALHAAQAGQTVVVKLYRVDVALAPHYRQGVLGKREMDGSLRHTRAVDSLVDQQVVSGKQRLFET